jgi:UDP-3-O-[3-hydroxymyristoyl] glucosamine N-acyltransferase
MRPVVLNSAVFTLQELAQIVGGTVEGDVSTEIVGASPFDGSGPGDITFAGSAAFKKLIPKTKASAVIVDSAVESGDVPLLIVKNPKLAFALILQRLSAKPFVARGVSPLASVGNRTRISENVSIHPFVAVGDGVEIEDEVTLYPGVIVGDGCRIGRGSTLHANVTLYEGVELGRRVIIHGGAVIGADGFGYVGDGEKHVKVLQTGTVLVGDDVEIGANTTVDRGTFGATRIEKGVKLDNLVHIGHNCRIGENTIIVGCVGISGSVEVGRNCIFLGQSGAVHHTKIGDNSTIMMKTAVSKNVEAGSVVSGNYCRNHKEELKIQAAVRRLPRMQLQLKEIRNLLEATQDQLRDSHE